MSRAASSRPSATPTPAPTVAHMYDHAPSATSGSRVWTGNGDVTPRQARARAGSVMSRSTVRTHTNTLSGIHELEQDGEDVDVLDEVVMAVDLRQRDTVGCAYYVARDGVMYLMEDAELGGKDVVELCVFAGDCES